MRPTLISFLVTQTLPFPLKHVLHNVAKEPPFAGQFKMGWVGQSDFP